MRVAFFMRRLIIILLFLFMVGAVACSDQAVECQKAAKKATLGDLDALAALKSQLENK